MPTRGCKVRIIVQSLAEQGISSRGIAFRFRLQGCLHKIRRRDDGTFIGTRIPGPYLKSVRCGTDQQT